MIDKDKRRKDLERKKLDRRRKELLKELKSNKYHQRVVEPKKEKGGSKNINQIIEEY